MRVYIETGMCMYVCVCERWRHTYSQVSVHMVTKVEYLRTIPAGHVLEVMEITLKYITLSVSYMEVRHIGNHI